MGQWYIFYHRHSGTKTIGRQAMMETADIAIDKNGKLFIGNITYESGEPAASKLVEMTSQGETKASAILSCGVIGKHAVYFEFISEETGVIASFDTFTFD